MKPDPSAYYEQTQNHYQRWWDLSSSMALHYGLWFDDTRNFRQALNNTNVYLAELGKIEQGQVVLDAGCGVGGSAIFLANNYNCDVVGITLSKLQVETAKQNAVKHGVGKLTEFKLLNYSDTNLPDGSFDVVWACESSSSSPDKQKMTDEWFRLLKHGGKLILSDFFRSAKAQESKTNYLAKWEETWAMSHLETIDQLILNLNDAGFTITQNNDLTPNIFKTARRMYRNYWLGLAPSVLYNTIFGARHYAKNHYKSGYYQYKSLTQNLWQYRCLVTTKLL